MNQTRVKPVQKLHYSFVKLQLGSASGTAAYVALLHRTVFLSATS